MYWKIEWENDGEWKDAQERFRHRKDLYREAGYTYTDAQTYADGVFDASPNIVFLRITLYDGDEVMCVHHIIN